VRWCSVSGSRSGPLQGLRVGLKDNIAVAGIPMTLGSAAMQGYVPPRDAVLVSRVLASGGEIAAICNMDDFAVSGTGESSYYGSVRNPIAPEFSAGGSSGGCAAALYLDRIDVSYGADQGGSVRVPASWCGVLGLKPTFGLVPYSGVIGLDQTIDHVGIMARTTARVAAALQAVAGADASDPRQGSVIADNYVEAVRNAPDDLAGLRVGVLAEGFRTDYGMSAPIEAAARAAVVRLRELGAQLVDVSVPEHLLGPLIQHVLYIEGTAALFYGFGNGYHWRGRYDPAFAAALHAAARERGNSFSPAFKTVLLVGTALEQRYGSTFYARAQNARRGVSDAFDRTFEQVDVLVMPTVAKLPRRLEGRPDWWRATFSGPRGERFGPNNTSPFNVTGHPALTMPCATAEGMPVGLQLVGRRLEDSRLLSVARTYEATHGWWRKEEASGEPI
jgi:amidase